MKLVLLSNKKLKIKNSDKHFLTNLTNFLNYIVVLSIRLIFVQTWIYQSDLENFGNSSTMIFNVLQGKTTISLRNKLHFFL